ncbi:MAG: putative toxin-antitoxin system toxin component, PIN family [Saprospiraceae bacterium]|nr:putative toxin-antitoxin system toxin component, PIN family [Saprospiraceae bacterium]
MKKDNKLPLVVLDTNVFLVSLAPQSDYAPLFDALLEGHFKLVISTEILEEYEEIIGQRYDVQTVNDIFELFLNLPNIVRQDVYYNWHFIVNDPDDDKFVDVAIACSAHYLVSNDRHFKILNDIPYPKVNLVKAEIFLEYCKNALSSTV